MFRNEFGFGINDSLQERKATPMTAFWLYDILEFKLIRLKS
jgi:hypothetical protein